MNMEVNLKTCDLEAYKRKSFDVGKKSIVGKYVSINTLISAVAGLFMSRGILGIMSPFGLAWYGAGIGKDKGLLLAATALGYAIAGGGTAVTLRYLFSVLIIALLRRYTPEKLWENPQMSTGICAGVALLTRSVQMIVSGFLMYDFVIAILESAVIWGSGIIFARGKKALDRGSVVNDDETVSIALIAAGLIAGLAGVEVAGVRAVNIVSIYILLTAGYISGMGISGAAGAILGLVCGLSQGDVITLTGTYAFMGIIGGFMKMFGKKGVAGSALLTGAIYSAVGGGNNIAIINMFEVIMAAGAFYFTPQFASEYLERITGSSRGLPSGGGYASIWRTQYKTQAKRLENSLTKMAIVAEKNYKRDMHAGEGERTGAMYERVASRICDGCSMSKFCWNDNFEDTYHLFNHITEIFKNQKQVKASSLPNHLSCRCVHIDALIAVFHDMFEIYRMESRCDSIALHYRGLAATQLKNIASCITHSREKTMDMYTECPQLELSLQSGFYKNGYNLTNVSVQKNSGGFFRIFLEFSEPVGDDICTLTSEIMHMPIREKYRTKKDNSYTVALIRKEKFTITPAMVAIDKKGGGITGDFGGWFTTEDGLMYSFLLDGMGSGTQAAIQSKEAARLLEHLIIAGVEPDDAIKMLNTAVIFGKSEEACIGADIAEINLYTGNVRIFKAGAPATVVKSKNAARLVGWSSCPIGILDIDNIHTEHICAEEAGCIIMMSDGVPDSATDRTDGEEMIKNAAAQLPLGAPAQETADGIIMAALAMGPAKDDMTVIALSVSA